METEMGARAGRGSSVILKAIESPEEAPLSMYEVADPTEVAVRRMWGRIAAGPSPRRTPTAKAWVLGVGFVALLLGLFVVVFWERAHPGPLLLEGEGQLSAGETIVTGDAARALAFEEGSRVELAPESHMSVVSNEGASLVLSLKKGSAEFSVTPGGPRRWTVEAGALVVSVLGTEFSVERTEDERGETTRVSVTRGVVAVSGDIPGRTAKLTAGESVTSMPKLLKDERPEIETEELPALGGDRVFTLDELEEEELEAFEEAARARANPGSELNRLLAEADEHRTAGHTMEAANALREVVKTAPRGDARRALAALSYARLGVEPREAAELLQMTLKEMPAGLREPALARLAEALALSGQVARASEIAKVYLSEFPDGPRAERVRTFERK